MNLLKIRNTQNKKRDHTAEDEERGRRNCLPCMR